MAYRMVPVLVTLNDLEGHLPVAGLFRCNPANICAAFYQISTDCMLTRSRSDSWASCSSRESHSSSHLHWMGLTQYLTHCLSTVNSASGGYRLRLTDAADYVFSCSAKSNDQICGQHDFCYSGPATWNSLFSDLDVIDANTLTT